MNKIEDKFGFYSVLTNPLRGYDYVTNILVEYEIPFVQLRMKSDDRYAVLKVAEMMKKITEKSSTALIINDDAQIALDCAADGAHLGQGDMSIAEARAMVGDDMLIGLSTHNPTETRDSLEEQIDYIGVGPVYKTPTKNIPDPVLGLETMAEMVSISSVPAICIGGISLERISDVFEAGGRNFSLVRPLCATEDPKKELKKIIDIQNRFIRN